MRQATLLTIANFGSAFTALLFYNQCSDGACHGDTKCPLCPACAEASKWYSQYTPDAKAGPSTKAAVEKSNADLSRLRVPRVP
ncbi:hypothetical protein FANTH_4505 [Fusarium anthophilum]|uniref:Uncharacterized protein n=1 Tax=Fusarium anthophilum TaxID=48485 RepID=A0A8H4ZQR2_9HYPO|nr:hypothetical protein FANTH_4505 [Fusarium anthophilum]